MINILDTIFISFVVGATSGLITIMVFPSIKKIFYDLFGIRKSQNLQKKLKLKAASPYQLWFLQNKKTREIEYVGINSPILDGNYKPFYIDFHSLCVTNPKTIEKTELSSYPNRFVENQWHTIWIYVSVIGNGREYYYEVAIDYEIINLRMFANLISALGESKELLSQITSIVEYNIKRDYLLYGKKLLINETEEDGAMRSPTSNKIWDLLDKKIFADRSAYVSRVEISRLTREHFNNNIYIE